VQSVVWKMPEQETRHLWTAESLAVTLPHQYLVLQLVSLRLCLSH